MPITKTTHRSGPFADFMADAVQVGDHLYLTGMIGMRDDGTVSDDLVEQLRQCYANVEAALAAFGADIDNVVDESYFMTDAPHFMSRIEEVAAAREEIFGGKPEVSQTAVQVAALVMPELQIEVKCIARL